MHSQQLYGLTVATATPLSGTRQAAVGASADVTIEAGPPIASNGEIPAGDVLLAYGVGEPWYCAVRLADGSYLLRYHGACDFAISADLAHVVVRSVTHADPGLATILTTGGLLAFLLYLRGHAVLHASAVDCGGGDGAIAFVGQSGRGKSTMATLMCADGGAVITDDVLRVDFDVSGTPRTRLGMTEFRLRKGADTLVSQFTGTAPGTRISADQRQVLQLADTARDGLPLAGIVIPTPIRDGSALHIDPLPKAEALLALLNMPRIQGWQDKGVVAMHFAHVGRIVRRVPVFTARVPWGPPFPPGIGAAVREAIAAARAQPIG